MKGFFRVEVNTFCAARGADTTGINWFVRYIQIQHDGQELVNERNRLGSHGLNVNTINTFQKSQIIREQQIRWSKIY